MATKAQIFNLALGALLLSRRIIDPENDTSNEAKVLRTHYDAAFQGALEDMDLDSTSTTQALELVAENVFPGKWQYAYKYPDDCARFRRISNCMKTDSALTRIKYRVTIVGSQKVILANEWNAVGEYVANDIPLDTLSATAAQAVAYRLAMLSMPLVTGKGSRLLMEQIQERYSRFKMEAQEIDRAENFQFLEPEVESTFVAARLGDF